MGSADAMPDSLLSLAQSVSETRAASLHVKIFADGADLPSILELAKNPLIAGFTTNPTLMRKAGVKDYQSFGRELTHAIPDRPFSFEVLSDDFDEMEQQALQIADWGGNVYVKIPITNTRRVSSAALIDRLSRQGVKVNVTAIMTLDQVDAVIPSLRHGSPACISIFAGRVADAGIDPLPMLCGALMRLRNHPQIELIWASPRELLNIVQADNIGCHIITVTHELLKKLPLLGRDLDDYSLETVRMFYDDARAAEFALPGVVAQALSPANRF
jgi:transaldolase